MAITGFSSENDLCASATNPNKVEQQVFWEGNISSGITLYNDAAKTTKKTSGYYLLVSGNRQYKIFVTTTGVANILGECTDLPPSSETLYAIPDFSVGYNKHNKNGSIYQAKLKCQVVESNGSLLLSDLNWNSWQDKPAGFTKAFAAGLRKNSGIGQPLVNVDISQMAGFDVDIKAYMESNTAKLDKKEWAEQLIHVPATTNRREWTSGDVTYYVMPSSYQFSNDSNLIQFDVQFPDFDLPSGQIGVIQPTNQRDIGVHNYAKKGCSHTKENPNLIKRFVFKGDEWLTNIGCPSAYHSSQSSFDQWLSNTSAQVILNSFKDTVYNELKDVGYIMLNWEHVGTRWNSQRHKLDACLDYWNNNPKAGLLAAWVQAPIRLNKYQITTGGANQSELLNDFKSNGTITDLQNRPGLQATLNYVSTTEKFAVFQVGNYVGDFYDYTILHVLVTEILMCKKYYPAKKVISTMWHDIEPADGYGLLLGQAHNQKNDGSWFWTYSKPTAFCAILQAYAVMSHFFGDGSDVWTDGPTWTDNPTHHGEGGTLLTDGNNTYGNGLGNYTDNVSPNLSALPHSFGPNHSWFAKQPMRNIDWFAAGKWAISKVKDILAAGNSPIFAEYSRDNGTNWVTGDDLIPIKAVFNNGLICAYKTNSSGNQAALVVQDTFNNPLEKKIIKVKIGSKIVNIEIFGQYASVVRVNNL